MKNILITGATGNVGSEVLKSLKKLKPRFNIIIGLRKFNFEDINDNNKSIISVKFDFTDINTFENAFENIDILFLLKPPQIFDIKKIFEPLIISAIKSKIKHIVFISVQGVENSKIIPHYNIEKLIIDSKIPYTFLRPAYFMQNFTTTLLPDLVNKKIIFLPAGKAKFTLIDVRDIANVAAIVLTNCSNNINKIYELTNNQKLTFKEMAEKLSIGLNTTIRFESPNLLQFYLQKRREKMKSMLIFVMIMLHYFPRFQKISKVTDCVKIISRHEPITFEKFINDNISLLKLQQ